MLQTAGTEGQVVLGKKYAGRSFDITEREDGTLILVPLDEIPESEAWLHTPEMQEKLRRAKRWCEENPPTETDLDELLARVKDRL
jgi:hypothetical protein